MNVQYRTRYLVALIILSILLALILYTRLSFISLHEPFVTTVQDTLSRPVSIYILLSAFIVTIGILVCFVGVAIRIVNTLILPKKHDTFLPLTPALFGLPVEEVTFPTARGEHLVSGWYITCPEATTTIILCPGFRRQKADLLGMCKHLWQEGHNVLAFEYYGHGALVGKAVTLGYREINDFLGAVHYAKERAPETRLGALGYSMGAAVTIMGSALTEEVEAVVADSAFASNWSAVEVAVHRTLHLSFRLPRWIIDSLYVLADCLLSLRAGYHFHQVQPVRDIRYLAPRPVLLIHGTKDTIISPEDATCLYEAAVGPKELWFIPEARHIEGFFVDSAAYTNKVSDFFQRHLRQPDISMKVAADVLVLAGVAHSASDDEWTTWKGTELDWSRRKQIVVDQRRRSRLLRLHTTATLQANRSLASAFGLAYGRLVYRLRWPIIVFWLVACIAGLPFAYLLPSVLRNSGYAISGNESSHVDQVLIDTLHHPATQVMAVFQSNMVPVTDAAYQREIHDFMGRAKSFFHVTDVISGGAGKDKYTTFVAIGFNTDKDTIAQRIPDLRALLPGPHAGPAHAYLTGDAVVANEIQLDTQSGTEFAEMVAMPLTLVALLIVFGTVVAGFIPLILAGVTMSVALAIVYLFAVFGEMNIFVLNMSSVIGLGLSIDYSLFIIRRFREELRDGVSVQDAVGRTVTTAGEAILFSGVTVALGFTGLLLIRIQIMTSFGIGGMAVAGTAVLAALTLLPALLGVLGRRINALRLPDFARRREYAFAEASGTVKPHANFWRKWATMVMRRPLLIIVVVIIMLVVLGWPALTLNPGLSDPSALPKDSEARHGLDILKAQFPGIQNDPLYLVVQASDGSSMLTPQNLSKLATLTQWLGSQRHVTGVASLTRLPSAPGALTIKPQQLQPLYSTGAYRNSPTLTQFVAATTRGDITLITVQSDTQMNTSDDDALIDRLRQVDSHAKQGFTLFLGGSHAISMDFNRTLYGNFIRALLFILGATYVLLLVTFRSVLLPLKAIIMNVLSISGAYGVLVFVFQQGHFANILNFTANGTIERFIPILMFCILFGLSMDYEVFLLMRVREEWLRTNNNSKAVALGLEKTGGVITHAALLFMIVTGSFTLTPLIVTKELGLGITVAILVDATIIRSLLVPATMQLMGRWNWWFPGQRRPAKQPVRIVRNATSQRYMKNVS